MRRLRRPHDPQGEGAALRRAQRAARRAREWRDDDAPDDKEAPIVTVCKFGERSLHGMLLLEALKSVRGGLDAWLAAGLPANET